ncbi:MAG: translocation/assembly module TamB domain-containing protein [Desulfobulbaceae bacterium]
MTRKTVFGLALGVLCLIAAGAGFFLATTHGLRLSLNMAGAVLPGTLSVNSIQGRLAGGLSLEGVVYKDAEIDVAIESLSLSWQPASLRRGLLHLRSLAVRGLVIRLLQDTAGDPPAAAEFFPPFALPFPVTVDKGSLSSLRLFFVDDPEPVKIDGILLEKVQGRGDRLRVGGIEVSFAAGRLQLGGEMRTSGEYQGRWSGDYAFQPPDFLPITGRVEMEGPLAGLAVRVDMAAPFAAILRGTVHELIGDVRWDAEIRASRAGLAEISPTWPEVALADFRASGSGTLDEYSLQVETDADYAPLPTIRIRTRITGDAVGLAMPDIQLGLHDEILAGEARLDWRDAFTWQASVSGERITLANINSAWPAAVFSGFRASGRGMLDTYSLQVETDLAYEQLQDLHVAGAIAGNGEGLRVTDLRLHRFDALLTGEGQLAWLDGFTWQAAARGTNIDPAAWQEKWPGRLDFHITTTGTLKENSGQGIVELIELDGMLRDYPLQASGRVEMDNETLIIDRLALSSAESTFQASGRYGEPVDLDFDLQSPDLAALWPGAGGSLQTRGRLSGSRQAPHLRFDLSGADISLADSSLAKVVATMESDLAPDGSLAGSVTATGVSVAGSGLDSISADLRGTAGKHQLQADFLAGSNSLHLQVEGGLVDSDWQGVIARAEFKEERFGSWQLGETAPLAISAQGSSLEQFCLAGPSSGRICLDGNFVAAGPWRAGGAIEGFPLDLVPESLLAGVRLEGQLSGMAEVEGDHAGIRSGRLELATEEGTAFLAHADASIRQIAWQHIGLQATLADDRLTAELAGLLADGGTMNASLLLEEFTIAPLAGRIDGNGQFEILDLQPLAALVYPTMDPSGRLHGVFSLQGDAAKPAITASFTLAEGEVKIPLLGTAFRELAMTVSGSFPEFRLELAGTSGEQLRGEGSLSLADPQDLELKMDIRGERVELARLPELDLLVSPDLAVVLRRDRGEVRGTIRIPEARIAPRDLAGAESPSADVVIVDSRQEPAKSPWSLAADILVIAGDDVRVDLFGLRGKVAGRLQVVDLPGKPVTGDGILNVVEGTFAVYGRELTIQTGSLLYSGNPIDNPGVDVRAENTTNEITTGIQVTGFLAEPEISFYSTPPMAEDEIISRLLMNTALLGSAEGDGGFLGGVTSGTGLDPLTSTVRGVKERLRLDDVKIATGKTREDLSLVIGTWLSPDLYVSYGKNLLKESGSFNTRYLLGYGFSVQTETGATQSGIDLKFEIDRY